jgi:hypothetical protein
MSGHHDYSVGASKVHRNFDNDDDLSSITGDEPERQLDQADVDGLDLLDDDPLATVKPNGALGSPQPQPELQADDHELSPPELDDVICELVDKAPAQPASNVADAPASASLSRGRKQAEMIRNALAEKKRKRNRERQRVHRAKPRQPSASLLEAALRKRTARPRGDKFIEQLVGRELELASFEWVSLMFNRRGPMSAARLARELGDDFTRDRVYKLRKIVAKLKAVGGPWHNG